MPTAILNDFIGQGMLGKSVTTIKSYTSALQQFEKWLEDAGTNLEGFGRKDVQQYIDHLEAEKKSASTINKIFNAIKTFSRWAGMKENIEDIRVIKPQNTLQQAPKALTKNEKYTLLRDIDMNGNKRDFAIVMLGLSTGIRLNELVALDRTDIGEGTLKVKDGINNEYSNKHRVIPLTNETMRALASYLEQRTDKEEPLFINNRYERLSPRMIQAMLKNKGFKFHQLRITFITELMTSGIDINTIRSIVGISSADMLKRYIVPIKED